MSQGNQGLIVIRFGEIGGTLSCCPCVISYTELKTYMTGGAGAVRMSTEAKTLMALIHKRMAADTGKRWLNDPRYVAFLETSTSHNNFRGYLAASPPDVPPNLDGLWHFVRRLSPTELIQLTEFRAINAMDADWDDWESKFEAAFALAKPMVMKRGLGQLSAMFTDPAQLAVLIGSIAVMFGPQGALLGAFRAILAAVGFGAQAYSLAGLLKDFAYETYYAKRPDDLKRAASYLADFLAACINLGLGMLLAKGVSKWQEAKTQAVNEHGNAPEPVTRGGAEKAASKSEGVPAGVPGGKGKAGELAEYKPNANYRDELPRNMKTPVEDLSRQSGVQPHHIGDWSRMCRENGWFAVLRTGKVAGLKLHFDEMTAQAKSVLVKWKTNERDGMIHRPMSEDIVETIYEKELPMQWASRNGLPAPHTPAELAAFKIKYKAQLDAWKAQNKFAWYWSKDANAAVLTHNGRIICSDYDKMGIYEHAGNGWRPQSRWAAHNDDPALQKYINDKVRGAQMDHHGCQDFSGGVNGRPVRQPSPSEKFLVFEPPDGMPRMIESVGELKALYQKYGVRWPYD